MTKKINPHIKLINEAAAKFVTIVCNNKAVKDDLSEVWLVFDRARKAEMALEALQLSMDMD